MPLTDTTVKNAKPREKDYKLMRKPCTCWESHSAVSCGGWPIVLMANKSCSLCYGPVSENRLKDARDRPDSVCKLLDNGIDPGEARKEERIVKKEVASTNNFAAVAFALR